MPIDEPKNAKVATKVDASALALTEEKNPALEVPTNAQGNPVTKWGEIPQFNVTLMKGAPATDAKKHPTAELDLDKKQARQILRLLDKGKKFLGVALPSKVDGKFELFLVPPGTDLNIRVLDKQPDADGHVAADAKTIQFASVVRTGGVKSELTLEGLYIDTQNESAKHTRGTSWKDFDNTFAVKFFEANPNDNLKHQVEVGALTQQIEQAAASDPSLKKESATLVKIFANKDNQLFFDEPTGNLLKAKLDKEKKTEHDSKGKVSLSDLIPKDLPQFPVAPHGANEQVSTAGFSAKGGKIQL